MNYLQLIFLKYTFFTENWDNMVVIYPTKNPKSSRRKQGIFITIAN